MRKPQYIGVKQARCQLSALLVDATKGRSTVITRYGKPVAAIVPAGQLAAPSAQRSLLSVAGSGKGLWGNSGRFRESYRSFVHRHSVAEISLETDLFDSVRDGATGRRVRL